MNTSSVAQRHSETAKINTGYIWLSPLPAPGGARYVLDQLPKRCGEPNHPLAAKFATQIAV